MRAYGFEARIIQETACSMHGCEAISGTFRRSSGSYVSLGQRLPMGNARIDSPINTVCVVSSLQTHRAEAVDLPAGKLRIREERLHTCTVR